MKRAAFFCSAAMTLSLLTGCSFHAMRPAPDAKAPASYLRAEDAAPAEAAGRWWESFSDDRLNGLMIEAFKNNLDIARAAGRVAQSEAAAGIAGAGRYPQVEAQARAGESRVSGNTSESYRLSAAASYEIDLFKKVSARTEAARAEAAASKEDMKALYISISARIADLYYLAVEQRAQLELTDRTIAAFADTLERVERRYEAGLVPALDLYQSRQNLAIAKTQRPLFQSNLERTMHAISVLLGRYPDKEVYAEGSVLPEPPEFSVGLPSQLLKRRPDLEAALLRVEASDHRVAAAVADRFPSFSLIGEYGGASGELSTMLDSPNIFWNIFMQAALPVIDGGRRKAEAERTDAVYRELLAAYRQAVLTSFKEVEDALSSGRASKERITHLAQRVDDSASALRLALDSYMAGLSDYLPVIIEQQRQFEAESALLAARRQLISDRIALARALGGHWADEAAGAAGMTGTDRTDKAAGKDAAIYGRKES